MMNVKTLTKGRFVKPKSLELMAITTGGFMASSLFWGSLPANAFSPNLYFVNTTGGYSSPDTTPPGSTVISGGFNGAGSATTNSINLAGIGIAPAEASSVTVQGPISYEGSAGDSVIANLLENNIVVQSVTLASGTTVIPDGTLFSVDFSSAVQANFNKDLAIQFIGISTSTFSAQSAAPARPLRATHTFSVTAVPEPLTMLGAATAVGFGTAFKRKLNASKSNKKEAMKAS